MMFWGKLSLAERDEFYLLMKKTGAWVAWASIKPKNRGPEPDRPTDEEWIRYDAISAKGWNI